MEKEKLSRKFIARFVDPSTGEVRSHRLNDRGEEIVSATPMAPPVGYKNQPSMFDHVRHMVLRELAARQVDAAPSAQELLDQATFLASDDDDGVPASPYEVDRLGALIDREREDAAIVAAAEQNVPPGSPLPAGAPAPEGGGGRPSSPPAPSGSGGVVE